MIDMLLSQTTWLALFVVASAVTFAAPTVRFFAGGDTAPPTVRRVTEHAFLAGAAVGALAKSFDLQV